MTLLYAYFVAECTDKVLSCMAEGQPTPKQTRQRRRFRDARLAVAGTRFQLRRYESAPLTCWRLPRFATSVYTSTRTSASGCTWSPLWERVVRRYKSAVYDGVCQIKPCWCSSELSSSARSTTAAQCWSASLVTSWTDLVGPQCCHPTVFSARRSEHITPLPHDLHWLQVLERIRFRLCVLMHRCLNATAPPYFAHGIRRAADSTVVVTSARRLSSSRPFVDPRSATGLSLSPLHGRATVCRRPS